MAEQPPKRREERRDSPRSPTPSPSGPSIPFERPVPRPLPDANRPGVQAPQPWPEPSGGDDDD